MIVPKVGERDLTAACTGIGKEPFPDIGGYYGNEVFGEWPDIRFMADQRPAVRL